MHRSHAIVCHLESLRRISASSLASNSKANQFMADNLIHKSINHQAVNPSAQFAAQINDTDALSAFRITHDQR